MIVWVDGELAYGYGRELDEIPPTDWDVMSTDGLTYRMLAVGAGVGGAARRRRRQGPPRVARPEPGHLLRRPPDGPLPRAVAWGHYEQSCRVTGDLVVGGHTIAFDGFGQRDHSWGFRHWAGLHQWHWVTGFLTDGRRRAVRNCPLFIFGPGIKKRQKGLFTKTLSSICCF